MGRWIYEGSGEINDWIFFDWDGKSLRYFHFDEIKKFKNNFDKNFFFMNIV